MSVCLIAKADGSQLKPCIVFDGAKREANAEFKNKCIVASSPSGWMNEELTLQWAKGILGSFSFNNRLLA